MLSVEGIVLNKFLHHLLWSSQNSYAVDVNRAYSGLVPGLRSFGKEVRELSDKAEVWAPKSLPVPDYILLAKETAQKEEVLSAPAGRSAEAAGPDGGHSPPAPAAARRYPKPSGRQGPPAEPEPPAPGPGAPGEGRQCSDPGCTPS